MSQFSELVKEAATRVPAGARTGTHSRPKQYPEAVYRKATVEAERKAAGAAGKAGETEAARILRNVTEHGKRGAFKWFEEKAIPAILTGTAGAAAAHVGKEHVQPWIERTFGRKKSLMERAFSNPNFRRAAVAGGGALALAAAIEGVEKASKHVGDKMSHKQGFKRLMAHNPSLAKEDPEHVAMLYETMHDMEPGLARNPLVAGSWVKKNLMYKDEGVHPNDLKTLMEIRRGRKDSGGSDSMLKKVFGPLSTVSGMESFSRGGAGK